MRCPNGTRKNKKTGECEKFIKNSTIKKQSTQTPKPKPKPKPKSKPKPKPKPKSKPKSNSIQKPTSIPKSNDITDEITKEILKCINCNKQMIEKSFGRLMKIKNFGCKECSK